LARPERAERAIDVHAAEQNQLDALGQRLECGPRVGHGHRSRVDRRLGTKRRDLARVAREIRARSMQVTHGWNAFHLVVAAVHDQHFVAVSDQLFEDGVPDESGPAEEYHSHPQPSLAMGPTLAWAARR